MNLFYVFLVILLIFFIPIPIKSNIYFSTKNYYIKLYGITLMSKKKLNSKKKSININDKLTNKIPNFFSKYFKDINFKSLLSFLYNIKFKPKLIFKFNLDYSAADAYKTAMLYGILYQFPPLIYLLITILFKPSKFAFKVNPVFEDTLLVKIEISSIIFISIANTIYIASVLHKFIRKQRR